MKYSDAFYVPIFGPEKQLRGIWVMDADHPNLKARLEMFAVGQGLPLEVFAAFASGNYRRVDNVRTDIGNNVVFEGGAFLMLGDAKAPNEELRSVGVSKKAYRASGRKAAARALAQDLATKQQVPETTDVSKECLSCGHKYASKLPSCPKCGSRESMGGASSPEEIEAMFGGFDVQEKSAKHSHKGGEHFMKGDFSNAKVEFLAAIQADPSSANDHENLGVTLCRLGEHSEAIPYLERALKLQPGKKAAHDALAEARRLAAQRTETLPVPPKTASTSPPAPHHSEPAKTTDIKPTTKWWEFWK